MGNLMSRYSNMEQENCKLNQENIDLTRRLAQAHAKIDVANLVGQSILDI